MSEEFKNVKLIKSNINNLENYLNENFIERKEAIRAIILGILTKEHVFFIGKPGAGKSRIQDKIVKSISGCKSFEVKMSKTVPPEALFGPINIKKFADESVYEFNTAGMLSEAHIASIDEIFKSNGAVLNNLLPILNERTFKQGNKKTEIPLWTAISASNEIPEEDDNLEALYDRFLIRVETPYIEEKANFIKFLYLKDDYSEGENTIDEINFSHIKYVYNYINRKYKLKLETTEAIYTLREKLRNEHNIEIGDRRIGDSIKVLKASYFLDNNLNEAIVGIPKEAIKYLNFVLWSKPKEGKKESEKEIVERVIAEILGLPMKEYENFVKEIDRIKNEFIELFLRKEKDLEIIKKEETRLIDSLEQKKSIIEKSEIGKDLKNKSSLIKKIEEAKKSIKLKIIENIFKEDVNSLIKKCYEIIEVKKSSIEKIVKEKNNEEFDELIKQHFLPLIEKLQKKIEEKDFDKDITDELLKNIKNKVITKCKKIGK